MDDNNLNNSTFNQETSNVVSTAEGSGDMPVSEGSMNVFTPESASLELEQPKRSKAPIVAGVVIVAAAAVATAGIMASGSPQKKVEAALVKTGTAIAERDSAFKVMGGEGIEALLKGACSIDQKISVVNMPDNEELNGAGLVIDIDQDASAKKGIANIKADYNGASLDVAQLYTDDTDIYIASPMLYDGVFTMSADNLVAQMKSSPVFSEYAEDIEDAEDFSVHLFETMETNDAAAEELAATFASNWSNMCSAMTFEKGESKEINGADAKGYVVTIPATAADTYIDANIDAIITNEAVQEQLMNSANMVYISEGYSTPQEYVDEINSQLEAVKNDLTVSDIVANIYISDGYVVDSEVKCDVTHVEGGSLGLTLTGGYDTAAGLTVVASFEVEGDTVGISYTDSVTNEGALHESYAVAMFSPTSEMGIMYYSDYNKDSGEYTGSIVAQEDGADMATVDLTGTLTGTDNSFDLNLSQVSVKDYDGEEIIDLSYDLSVAPFEDEITAPEGETVRIFEISRDEWDEIAGEIQTSLIGLAMQLQ